jgi:hypothetical protein
VRGYPPEYFAAKQASSKVRSLAEFAAEKQARSRPNRASMSIRNALEQADAMRKSESWKDAGPEHFVAIWALLHLHVYGVEPSEVADQQPWGRACMAASILLVDQFDGDREVMIDFVRWAWAQASAQHRRGRDSRLKWQFLFSASMVTDYRVALTKRAKGK